MTSIYDLIVIGTGTAGSICAFTCRRAGWRVAVVDERPFGGTCALRGCDPKKVLTGAAEAVDRCRLLKGKGISGRVEIDWPGLIAYKRSFTEPVPAKREQAFSGAGVETFHGPARFSSPDLLEVGNQTLRGRRFVIASGAAPAPLSIAGAEHLTTSEQFLDSPELPGAILFIGGGFISFEFAWAAAAAGSQVTILQMDARPLAAFDRDLVTKLLAAAQSRQIEVRLNMPAQAIERQAGGLLIRAGRQGENEFMAGMAVNGAGRIAKVEDLGLEAAGVRYDRSGILVNEYLQSLSNPAVFAAGDAAAAGPMLTPVAALHGRVAAHNLLNGNSARAVLEAIPSVVFTHPPLARVGLLPEEAKQQGFDLEIKTDDISSWYSARRIGLQEAGYKIVLEKNSRRILGAHLLTPAAEETINILALAMRLGISATDLVKNSWSYPSSLSDLDYMLS